MKILVLATDYPKPDGYVASFFIHIRNKWYVKEGIDVSVISFSAKEDYAIDGVKVYTTKTYERKLKNYKYDFLVSHAPNLRNHYKFLKKHDEKFSNVLFFFHGHEVLQAAKVYPRPYSFTKKDSKMLILFRNFYDKVKLIVLREYFSKIAYKSQFVFVSNWMYEMFIKFVKLDYKKISGKEHIIYNCIGESFEKNYFDKRIKKEYDFITIRNILDNSKYGIDIVTKVAENNPQYKFCVVGKGKFYKFNKKPSNIVWINRHLTHEDIIEYLNKSRCAFIPTKADAQGVMACEMATFGIPVITSDIDVCKEVFEGFENVAFIDNDRENIDVKPILRELENIEKQEKNEKYFAKNTIGKEIKLFKR